MGSCFIAKVIESTDSNKVKEVFDDIVEECEEEYGNNSYNGTFSTMSGLSITGRRFNNRLEAQEYIVNNTSKWGNALAVTVEEAEKKPYTLVGGWAAE